MFHLKWIPFGLFTDCICFISGGYFSIPPHLSPLPASLVTSMLQVDPMRRATMDFLKYVLWRLFFWLDMFISVHTLLNTLLPYYCKILLNITDEIPPFTERYPSKLLMISEMISLHITDEYPSILLQDSCTSSWSSSTFLNTLFYKIFLHVTDNICQHFCKISFHVTDDFPPNYWIPPHFCMISLYITVRYPSQLLNILHIIELSPYHCKIYVHLNEWIHPPYWLYPSQWRYPST